MTLFGEPPVDQPSAAVTPFDYRGACVRTVPGDDGEVWFVATDVCAVLGLSQVSRALSRLDDDQRSSTQITSPNGRTVSVNVVSEPGLYDLVIRSDKPEAKPFRRWVTHDVLPQIRKTGSYSVPEPREPELTELEVAERTVAALKRNQELERVNAELAPAADAWSNLCDADGDYAVSDAAKILDRDPDVSTGQRRLFDLLHDDLEWVYRGGDGAYRAKQRQVDIGRLVEKPQYRWNRDGERVLAAPQVRVTLKGLEFLLKHLKGSAPLAVATARQEITR